MKGNGKGERERGGLELLRGAEAIGLAALMSGVEAYFGYPITPSSEIMEFMASEQGDPRFPRYRAFVQASSEVEAVNMLMGAGAAGHLAMTATSGLGLSLMVEGISHAYTAGVPFLIVDVNRGGPGLGTTEAEQSDYLLVTKSLGSGGSRAIVLAPQGVEEAMEHVNRGFRLAFEYRIPVVILTDAIVAHMRETVDMKAVSSELVPVDPGDTGWATRGKRGRAVRNMLTTGFLDSRDLRAFKEEAMRRWARISAREASHECYMCDGASTIYVSFGISARIAREVVDEMREEGVDAGLFRAVTLSPFPAAGLSRLRGRGIRFRVMEMNEGQMYHDVREVLGPDEDVELVPLMGGIVTRSEV
ncbi:2-oxoglutarate oxidoreductase, alpha subunit [Conexivisphaera calida]|uniref:2-oxoglutarate oxidoreductase, alpha subunit n=1 Tax=Conexivisphaera calida TaxID=1874277 RepID=A0A4V0P1L9_9ARCH|nr:2-oxoglutarate oxidoreductase, alpha subunit [Conexivisphaera calida]